MAYDLSLDEIANRIIDAILNERHINKENLHKLIRPILKIWIKQVNQFRKQRASKSKLQSTIENRGIQQQFWKEKFKNLVGEKNMQPYYNELDSILIKEGFKKPNI